MNLLKSGSIFFLGNILLRSISFLTLPIFTRLMLPEEFGMYSVYSATAGIVSIFLGLQINGTVNIAYTQKTEKEFEEYVANISLFPIFGLVVALTALIFLPTLSNQLGLGDNIYYIMVVVQSLFGLMIAIYSSELVIKQQPKKHLLFSIVTTISTTFLSLSFIYYFKNDAYFERVSGGVIASLLVSLYVFKNYFKRYRIKTIKTDWIYGLKLSTPLIFHALSGQLLNFADRFMLVKMATSIDVALYSFAYSIGMIIQMIWMSLNSAWVPWYYDCLKEQNSNDIKIYSKYYIVLFTLGTISFIFLTPELIFIMGGEQYNNATNITPLIAISYYFVFLYSFYVNYEFSQANTKVIPIATTLAAIANIGLNLILIPIFGVTGATISTVISYFFMFLLHYIVVTYVMKHRDFPTSYIVVALIILTLSTLVFYAIINYILWRMIFIISTFVVGGWYLFIKLKKEGVISR